MDLTDRILDKAGREHWKIKVQNGLVSLQCSYPAMEMITDRVVHKVPKLESRKPFASELSRKQETSKGFTFTNRSTLSQ